MDEKEDDWEISIIEEMEKSECSYLREPLLAKTINNTSQIATVGAKVCPIESLDYEIIETDLYMQYLRSSEKVELYQYVALKWTLSFLVGLTTGLVAFFNNLAVENISGFKILLTDNLMLKEKYRQAFAVYAGCNLILAVAAAALCTYVAPAAAGSGIPEVKAYLNGVDAYSILAPSTLFVKIPPIVGNLTRHDFMPEHVLRLFPHLDSSKTNHNFIRTNTKM